MQKELRNIYQNRFKNELKSKNRIWKILCEEYFQKFINAKDDTVLDIAAGYGEFLNNIKAKRKIAVDLNEDIRKFVNEDVEVIISDCRKIENIESASIDKIFISNFLEHLNNTDEVIQVLQECHRLLKRGGEVLILQPNIYYVKEKYWFFIDHKTPLTHGSLVEALEICGFEIVLIKKKFLPYSTKSFLPQNNFFIKTYLKIPIFQQIFGKQSFVVGKKL
ncbi:MAG: SAM-dependent methyltransferase [Candidatus Nealsonbacteria bacterium CG23_combo_of_CG06-09_8_20_14_all_37_18]|uniref:SAM-dependent methyltransferase n=2 Tax=Candidatus Nealsoniibacteriota TaxID=1817911 RepID=A0A2G9YYD3_9BACT|nr:MAG: SAM-dependent methyltransferase [Candidatus Nealsonbacteria bacterium CG23_combo_of_CG06-09_8_20_14_all_37_18]